MNPTINRIVNHVRQRGYFADHAGQAWSREQMAARQILKATEELAEAAELMASKDPAAWRLLTGMQNSLDTARQYAEMLFVDQAACAHLTLEDAGKAAEEMADVLIPIVVGMTALGIDPLHEAVRKSGADVRRGVTK